MITEDLETGDLETGRPRPEKVTVTIHSASGVLMAVMFEGQETVSLALDDEKLVEINRALALAGACVDFTVMEGGAR
jgi:hypothetical protein